MEDPVKANTILKIRQKAAFAKLFTSGRVLRRHGSLHSAVVGQSHGVGHVFDGGDCADDAHLSEAFAFGRPAKGHLFPDDDVNVVAKDGPLRRTRISKE